MAGDNSHLLGDICVNAVYSAAGIACRGGKGAIRTCHLISSLILPFIIDQRDQKSRECRINLNLVSSSAIQSAGATDNPLGGWRVAHQSNRKTRGFPSSGSFDAHLFCSALRSFPPWFQCGSNSNILDTPSLLRFVKAKESWFDWRHNHLTSAFS